MDNEVKKETQDIELIIGQILRIGVIIAAAVIVLGLALLLITGQSGYPAGVHPSKPGAILQGVIAFKPYAVLMLGLFLLILTPVLRVVVSIYAFIKEKDHLYAWITTIVLVILVIAMVIGYLG
ncbi:MAG: DUF1634 domain-containing protein [Lactobacillus sp.]|jgi:uncharacterized membrane protein|uniref:DUF1634 domain-containing protein n=1 Tax=Lacticaseibacillus suilingensis TaxID=2799577 RepID=A0ABW4BCQ5_9LACO|nr:DUF1634 domain-containing protein [Lacticaseibacillus suilingensis]MCI1895158.1 DUF1634 domain-containing protein [Lactobacillus sp.]MCI1917930.1 DUF1634 domain-containing protein [Lactobacillus sp.]MCI1940940.1 DUF1634 domain-containing protein [Lactobacillus sp.]MCI1971587.1 DUF1634 domain-containing protein [Lactobacillus sp.]MCI2017482.1 DUF1634 domain-containing protein [Lactobacillus sp.]